MDGDERVRHCALCDLNVYNFADMTRAEICELLMIDAARIDERDLPLTLSLICHAAERLQLPARELFDAAASLSEPRTAEIMRSFVRETATHKDIQKSWGYQEIQGPGGAGFVQRDFDAYEPTRDLLRALLAVREGIRRDHYEGDVTLATELPSVWSIKRFEGPLRTALREAGG